MEFFYGLSSAVLLPTEITSAEAICANGRRTEPWAIGVILLEMVCLGDVTAAQQAVSFLKLQQDGISLDDRVACIQTCAEVTPLLSWKMLARAPREDQFASDVVCIHAHSSHCMDMMKHCINSEAVSHLLHAGQNQQVPDLKRKTLLLLEVKILRLTSSAGEGLLVMSRCGWEASLERADFCPLCVVQGLLRPDPSARASLEQAAELIAAARKDLADQWGSALKELVGIVTGLFPGSEEVAGEKVASPTGGS